MNEHRYILERYSGTQSRYICPSCKRKEFSRYVDTETKQHLSPAVGRCNRESNCGYHYTPRQYFQDNNFDTPPTPNKFIRREPTLTKKPISFIPVEVFKASLQNHEPNNFIKFLLGLFPADIVKELISKYFIGTSNFWFGSTIFWQIDLQGRIRTGKVMLYNADTGKRFKVPFNHIAWVHKALKQPEYELKQCFFGEHLLQVLQDKSKPAAIVESDKTAVISSVYFPDLIWLAAGSLNNINPDKCQVLRERKVILFPDVNGFDKWNLKAKQLNFTCSDLLERKASSEERNQGLDLADYLIRFDYRTFTEPTPTPPVQLITQAKRTEPDNWIRKAEKPQPENWLPEIRDLEQFFRAAKLPAEPIKLDQCSRVTNLPLFIESHLSILRSQSGNIRYKPYLDRLNMVKEIIKLSLN